MAKPAEIRLQPGWLANDVKRAQSRLEQWQRATEVLQTQADAIARSRQLSPDTTTHAERPRHTPEGEAERRRKP
jgi:hypothetical protein